MHIAILDDYHGVAERYADWTTLGAQARVQVFRDALPSGPRAPWPCSLSMSSWRCASARRFRPN